MSKVSKFLAVSGLVVLSVGMSGCQNAAAPAPQKAPEVVLQEGLTKLSEVKSYNYDVKMMGDLKGPQGEKPEKVKFNFGLKGGVQASSPTDPKFTLAATGDMSADADGGSGELAFRMNKDAVYMNLMKLEGKGSVAIPEEMKAKVIGKWWTLPVPPEALEELSKSVPQGGDENLTAEQKEIKALVAETKFFKSVEYKGTESIGGEQSYHYAGALDEAAFMDFVAKASKIQGKEMTESDKVDMKKAMELFDFTGDMYVGQTSGLMNKMKGTLTFTGGSDSPTGTVGMDIMLSDFNKDVTVEVPKDAQPIPMEALGALPL